MKVFLSSVDLSLNLFKKLFLGEGWVIKGGGGEREFLYMNNYIKIKIF